MALGLLAFVASFVSIITTSTGQGNGVERILLFLPNLERFLDPLICW
jgi:hypothetical protein